MNLLGELKPPYYAVIFTSLLRDHVNDYQETNRKLLAIAKEIPGFLGEESVRNGLGVSVSYWRDKKSIEIWRQNMDHILAKKRGKEEWYKAYTIRIAKVEWEHEFRNTP